MKDALKRTALGLLLLHLLVGCVFLSEGIQKFLFPAALGAINDAVERLNLRALQTTKAILTDVHFGDPSDRLSQTIRMPDPPPWTDARSTLAPAGLSSEADQDWSSIRERTLRRERPAILAADRRLSAVCADIWHSAGCQTR